MSPLDKNLIKERDKLMTQVYAINKQFNSRMEYIFDTIKRIFDIKYFSWEYADCDDRCSECDDYSHHSRSFWGAYENNKINIHFHKDYKNLSFLNKDGVKYNIIQEGIPSSWLFEDFEQELEDGVKKLKEYYSEQSAKLQQIKDDKKKKKEALLESIKSKLSEEELALISVKKK